MTTEPQQTAVTDPTLTKIEGRVAHIESLVAWMFTLMVLSMIAGLIIGIVIAVSVGHLGSDSIYP